MTSTPRCGFRFRIAAIHDRQFRVNKRPLPTPRVFVLNVHNQEAGGRRPTPTRRAELSILHSGRWNDARDATKMTFTAKVFVYCGGSRALMCASSSFSCRTSSSKRSRREGAGPEATEGPLIDSSVRAGIVTAPLKRCA